jgi:hypothetical protein
VTVNHWVGGSSPSGGAIQRQKARHVRAFCFLRVPSACLFGLIPGVSAIHVDMTCWIP